MTTTDLDYYDLTVEQEQIILAILLSATGTQWEHDGEKFEAVRTWASHESPKWDTQTQKAVETAIKQYIPNCHIEMGDFDAELCEGGRVDYEHVTIYKQEEAKGIDIAAHFHRTIYEMQSLLHIPEEAFKNNWERDLFHQIDWHGLRDTLVQLRSCCPDQYDQNEI